MQMVEMARRSGVCLAQSISLRDELVAKHQFS